MFPKHVFWGQICNLVSQCVGTPGLLRTAPLQKGPGRNAKCPIFLGNFTPKTQQSSCLKNRAPTAFQVHRNAMIIPIQVEIRFSQPGCQLDVIRSACTKGWRDWPSWTSSASKLPAPQKNRYGLSGFRMDVSIERNEFQVDCNKKHKKQNF